MKQVSVFVVNFETIELNVILVLGLRVCLLQFAVQENLTKTLKHLEELVSAAVIQHQPEIIALPECFSIAYCTDNAILTAVAESISDGIICRTLSKLTKQFGVYIVGGSIIERHGADLYNTSTVWNSNGELIARHRKVKCLRDQRNKHFDREVKCDECFCCWYFR